VTLVPRDGIGKRSMFVAGLRCLVEPPADGARVPAQVKVRARHEGAAATIEVDGALARVTFAEPVAAITPGQAAVFYDGERVLGGGWIDGAA